MDPSQQTSPSSPESNDRRSFFLKIATGAIGLVAGLIPFASGLLVVLDPLRRKPSKARFLRVTTLDSVPEDGMARRFPVIADRIDAWTNYPNEPVGAVYLRRKQGEPGVQVFNAICPHAGCFVDYNLEEGEFQCPCHDSRYSPEGIRIDPAHSPSPRDLDTLDVDPEKLAAGEVWVAFMNFITGTPDKIAKS